MLVAAEFEGNAFRICSGRNNKIEFELSLVAIVDQINARINSPISDTGIVRNASPPFATITADEIVALPREFVEGLDLSFWVGTIDANVHGTFVLALVKAG